MLKPKVRHKKNKLSRTMKLVKRNKAKDVNSKTNPKKNKSKANLNSNKLNNLKSSSETINNISNNANINHNINISNISNTSNIDNVDNVDNIDNVNDVNSKISDTKNKTSYIKDEWDENGKNTWKLIDNYFEQCGKKQLIRHQIESYNDFVDNQIVDIINQFNDFCNYICKYT